MIVDIKVEWYDEYGILIDSDISDCLELALDNALELKNNKATLSFMNPWNSSSEHKYVDSNGNILFKEGQILKIYAKHAYSADDVIDTSVNSSDLLMVADITEFSATHTEGKESIKIVATDKSYIMLNKTWSEVYTASDAKTAPEIIQQIIRHTSQSEIGVGSWSVGSNLTTDDPAGNITASRRNTNEQGEANTDTAFPAVTYQNLFKPLYEWIKELSQIEYTNTLAEISSGTLVYGRPFLFYIDENNEFHWFYPDDTNTTTVVVGTDIVYDVNMTKKVFDVTNMIIFGAGNDMNGVQIIGYQYDETSDSRTLKMQWQPMENIAKDLIREDYNVNTVRDAGTAPQFPDNGQYPLTPAWSPTNTYAGTVANDTEYNDSLWEAAMKKGKGTADRILKGTSHARWKGDIEVLGKKYTPGTLIEFTDSSIGLNAVKIRIMKVNHIFRKDSWVTTLDLEQDAKALGSV